MFALFLLPFVAALLLRLSRERLSQALPAVGMGAAALGLLGAWLWRTAGVDAVVANWSIASFFGTALAIAAPAGGATAVIALAAGQMLASADADDPAYTQAFSHALMTAAAALALLASTMPTLLIGIGLLDASAMWMAARRMDSRRAVGAYAPQVFGLLAAMLALSLTAALTHSFMLAGIAGSSSALATTVLSVAVCAHAGVLPLSGSNDAPEPEQMMAGVIGAVAIAQNAPTLDTWAVVLLVFATIVWALRAIATRDAQQQTVSIQLAAAGLSIAAGVSVGSVQNAAALGGAAWLLGSRLLGAESPLRLFGALSLAGVPPLAGFAAQSGIAAATALSSFSLAIVVLLAFAQALLMFALLSHVLRVRPLFKGGESWSSLLRAPLRHLPALVVVLHLTLLGLAPALSGTQPPFAAMGAWGWASLAVSIALALALARASASARLSGIDTGMDVPQAAAEVLRRIQPASHAAAGLMLGAIERIRTSFRLVFTMLESDGALLWACLFTLIAVLIGRSGTP